MMLQSGARGWRGLQALLTPALVYQARRRGTGRWTRETRQRAKGNTRVSTSEPAVKAIKVLTSIGELERKGKVEDGTTEQVT
jgi:hypothetical protein